MAPSGQAYWPAWTEVALSAGVVAAAALAFLFLVERFRVWEERSADPEEQPLKLPEFDKVGMTWLGPPPVAGRTLYSLGFVFAATLAFAFLPPQPAASRGVDPQPVHRARGGSILWIDGNLDGFGVSFPHQRIQRMTGTPRPRGRSWNAENATCPLSPAPPPQQSPAEPAIATSSPPARLLQSNAIRRPATRKPCTGSVFRAITRWSSATARPISPVVRFVTARGDPTLMWA
jgi:hypothetical protein